MKIIREMTLDQFEPWSGAEDTLYTIQRANKIDEFESIIEEEYPDGIDETTLNDLLRFDKDWVYDVLDIKKQLTVLIYDLVYDDDDEEHPKHEQIELELSDVELNVSSSDLELLIRDELEDIDRDDIIDFKYDIVDEEFE